MKKVGFLGALILLVFSFMVSGEEINLLKDKSIIRHYKFSEVKENKVKNLCGTTGDLVFKDLKARPGEPFAEEIEIETGHKPDTKAVKLNKCSFIDADYIQVDTGPFTFVCWVNVKDYGDIQPGKQSGTIAAVSSGYYGGWRLIVATKKTLTFAIGGRDSKGSTVGTIIEFNKWYNIAAVWNGKQQLIYIDGVLKAEREYAGPYLNEKKLVIGYAGYGVGSLNMAIEEAIIFNRALTNEEIRFLYEKQK